MSAITRLRQAGFRVRLLGGEKIGIKPIEHLTDTQRAWISARRDSLITELKQESANNAINGNIGLEPDRWAGFVALATAHGVTADEVARKLTKQYIGDLLTVADANLPMHAKTIADAIIFKRQPRNAANHQPHVFREPVQTCGACRHFERMNHPHLGHCRIQAEPEAPAGHWDTERRDHCQRYIEVAL